jgi:transcriptional regulator with XRE-family HTH domain
MIDVGKNIRRFRVQKKLTQDALAGKLHVTRQAVSNWETGKNLPDLDMLEALAAALDREPGDLLGSAGDKYPRFQTRAVVWTAVLGLLTLFLAADALWIAPLLHRLRAQTFQLLPELLNDMAVQPLCITAVGMLLPAAASLVRDVQPSGRFRTVLRILPFPLLLPAAALLVCLLLSMRMAGVPTRIVIFFFGGPAGFRLRLACRWLPFLAGLCLYPGYVRLNRK